MGYQTFEQMIPSHFPFIRCPGPLGTNNDVIAQKIAHNFVDKEVTEDLEADNVSPAVDVEVACNEKVPRFCYCLKLTDEEKKVSILLFVSFLKAMRERSRDVGVAFCCVCLVLLPSVGKETD